MISFIAPSICQEAYSNPTIAFAGDTLFGRIVGREASAKREPPWASVFSSLNKWDYVVVNFECAVGDENLCKDKNKKDSHLCFNVTGEQLNDWGKLPFDAINFENNHACDLGEEGRKLTADYMSSKGVEVLTWALSPNIIALANRRIAIISINSVVPKSRYNSNLYELIPQKARLAHYLADFVVLDIHWGIELQSWPNEKMKKDARWFIDNGVDVIIGHHPHVIIPPAAYDGKPVFYSLGNFIFDQKYAETKKGLVAVASIDNNGRVGFSTYLVETGVNSVLPWNISAENSYDEVLKKAVFKSERKKLNFDGLAVSVEQSEKPDEYFLAVSRGGKNVFNSPALPLLAVYSTKLRPKLNENVLVTLENHYSSMDNQMAPRPYVYRVTKNGLVALWRGSALARPIVDMFMFNTKSEDYLCVLHRGDSYLEPDPGTKKRMLAFYAWNGFGFNIVENVPQEVMRKAKLVYGDISDEVN